MCGRQALHLTRLFEHVPLSRAAPSARQRSSVRKKRADARGAPHRLIPRLATRDSCTRTRHRSTVSPPASGATPRHHATVSPPASAPRHLATLPPPASAPRHHATVPRETRVGRMGPEMPPGSIPLLSLAVPLGAAVARFPRLAGRPLSRVRAPRALPLRFCLPRRSLRRSRPPSASAASLLHVGLGSRVARSDARARRSLARSLVMSVDSYDPTQLAGSRRVINWFDVLPRSAAVSARAGAPRSAPGAHR